VCWTAGVKAHPVVANLGLPLDERGRLRTDSYLQVEGQHNVWAVGDAAAVPDPSHDFKKPTPPTAQHAIRQGRLVGRNVAAAISGGRKRPFRYKNKGAFVDLGRRQAVASTMGIKWRGTPAWILARSYHLAMVPGLGRRARLLTDWNVGLLFGRDTVELGQLGHPPALSQGGLEGQSSGGTGAQGQTVSAGAERQE
jgi:NADH dehydrogenase